MINYLAKLLGLAMRRIRTNKISSTDTAKALKIHDSKYRSIESGGQIFDPELVVPLKQIEAFKDVQPDRLSLFITYCYFFQEKIIKGKRELQNSTNKIEANDILEGAIDVLIKFDNSVELFLDKTILDESRFDYDTAVTNVIDFLKKKDTSLDEREKISRLKKQLTEIENNTLCVFFPLLKTYVNEIRTDLENLSKFKNISERIDDLEEKIKGIKDLKINFNTINAPEFVQVHKYQEVKGTILKAANLLDPAIIKMYSSYMKQVWLDSLKSIKFIFLDDDETKLTQVVTKYRSEIMYKQVYFPEYGLEKAEHFYNGLEKIEFRYINKIKQKELLNNLLKDNKEFWFYHSLDSDGESIKYGFMTFQIKADYPTETIEPDSKPITQYKILTMREVQDASDAFNTLWNNALRIF